MNARSKALKGYEARDSVSHRTYNRETSVKRFHKTGEFSTRSGGGGHKAGFEWAKKHKVDPNDAETKYSKNSPSFDEGVYQYKLSAKTRALHRKKN